MSSSNHSCLSSTSELKISTISCYETLFAPQLPQGPLPDLGRAGSGKKWVYCTEPCPFPPPSLLGRFPSFPFSLCSLPVPVVPTPNPTGESRNSGSRQSVSGAFWVEDHALVNKTVQTQHFSEKKWQYGFELTKEVPVWYTISLPALQVLCGTSNHG